MSTRAFAGALALLMTTAPSAWAQLTADEVWADWQESYGAFGMALSADASKSGETLTLNDLTMTINIEELAAGTNYGSIALVEQADGTVRIEVPSEMTVVTTTTVDGDTIEQTAKIIHQGFDGVVAQQGEERVYTLRSDSFAYAFDDVTGGEAPQAIPLTMSMTDMDSRYTITEGDGTIGIAQSFAASGLVLEVEAQDADEPFQLRYMTGAIGANGAGSLPQDLSLPDTPSLADLAINFDVTFTHGGSDLTIDVTTPDGPFNLTSTSTGGEVFIALTPDGITETFASTGIGATVLVPQFPVPVAMSMDAFSAGFTLPIGVSEDAKPFGLELALRALSVDEAIWGLFDPTGQLPRDPATLVLDVTGDAIMSVDILGDPEAMAFGPPGELETLSLNDLTLSFGGADLAASGDLTFPTPDPSQPVGAIEIAINGAFALVDRFVALGFLPPEQAAFAKGMAGAVSRPVGDDQLESTIEFTEGGGINANGFPLR